LPRYAPSLVILILLCGCATQPVPQPALPDTALGRIATEFLAAVNSKTDTAIETFVTSRYSTRALREESASERIGFLKKLRQQSGGLDLVEVTPAASPRPMFLLARSRRGERYVRIIMGTDHENPEKLAGTGVERSEPPAAERARFWPSTARTEAQKIAAIRKELDRRATAGTFSGVLLIARGDEILLHEARGWADREAQIPNRIDTKFHLASVGKMFTAAAIGQLVRSGKVSFDAKVIDVLPDYPNREVGSKISIHHLLTHSAGLGTFFGSPGFVPGKRYATEFDQIEVFKDEKLFFEPGTKWRYSNAGFAVLGAIVERLSGQSYVAYLRQHLFAPLGMNDTYIDTAAESAPAVSIFYRQSETDPLGLDPFVADRNLKSTDPSGFGGGFSTTSDLLRFARALKTGQLLGPELTAVMTEPKIDSDGRGKIFWAYGMAHRVIDGEPVRGHSGGGRADVEMLWNSDYTIVILTNAVPPPADAFGTEIATFLADETSR
jgi:D-alanyl-D-alanine carboxypeptidase